MNADLHPFIAVVLNSVQLPCETIIAATTRRNHCATWKRRRPGSSLDLLRIAYAEECVLQVIDRETELERNQLVVKARGSAPPHLAP